MRYEELVAQSERDNFAAGHLQSQHGKPLHGVQSLAGWLGAAGTSLLRTLQWPFERPSGLSTRKQ